MFGRYLFGTVKVSAHSYILVRGEAVIGVRGVGIDVELAPWMLCVGVGIGLISNE